MTPRILYAGFFHETNTFVDGKTTWSDFSVAREAEIFAKLGDGSVADGFLSEAHHQGWAVVPTIDAWAVPSGMVDDAAFEFFWSEFSSLARSALEEGIDGIFIVLHGAMVTGSFADAEGELLARIRTLPGAGKLPLFGVLDLHANVTALMCRHADGLSHYRENPHFDAKEAGQRSAQLLARCLREKSRPHMTWCRPPLMWAPPGTGTSTDPMRALEKFGREVESKYPDVWEFNVAAGFSFADMADTGVSLSVISRQSPEDDRRILADAAELAWSLRKSGVVVYPTARVILDRLSEQNSTSTGPVLLVEPADNIGAGAPGDGTGILRALVAGKTANALLAINDPAAVTTLVNVAIGETCTLAIGGRGSRLDAGPVVLEVSVVSRSSGLFKLEDHQSHLAAMSGDHFAMGDCTVVKSDGITILLTSRRTPPMDLGQYRSQGIEPRDFTVIGVKAAVAHRRAYDRIARASYFVDTAGPCTSDLERLPWKRLQRPVWPLDTDTLLHCRYA